MLLKQELKRYEKELELKAGKGFLNNNLNNIEFHNTISNNFSSFSANNNNFDIITGVKIEKSDQDIQKNIKLESETYVNKTKLSNDYDDEDFKIKKM